MKSRKFPTFDEAIQYLEAAGELKYFGRAGLSCEYCVYTLTVNGRKYYVDVYDDGKVVVKE